MKQYIYYCCSNAKGICKRVYVRDEVLMETIQSYFGKIQLPQETIEEITKHLRTEKTAESEYHNQQMKALRKEQDKIQARISSGRKKAASQFCISELTFVGKKLLVILAEPFN